MVRAVQLGLLFGGALLVLQSCAVPEVCGKHTLSSDDIHQIQILVLKRFDIAKPITRISVETPNDAMVEAGVPQRVGEAFFLIPVHKTNGQWRLSPRSKWQRIEITAI